MAEKEAFRSSVYLIIKNENGEILLQRRQGTKLWPNFLALPAGHIDEGEDPYQASIREAKEELGIEIKFEDLINPFVVCRRNKTLPPYFDVYFEVSEYEGNIQIMEPNKCSELVWADINNLPKDIIPFEKKAIENYSDEITFSTIYVDDEEENKKGPKLIKEK